MKPLMGWREHHLKCHWFYAKKRQNRQKSTLFSGLLGPRFDTGRFETSILYPYNYTLKSSGRSLSSTAHPIPEARPQPPSEAVKMGRYYWSLGGGVKP